MKRAAANAAPLRTSAVASGIAAFEVGVEVCEEVRALALVPVVVVVVPVGVASALLTADETWAE